MKKNDENNKDTGLILLVEIQSIESFKSKNTLRSTNGKVWELSRCGLQLVPILQIYPNQAPQIAWFLPDEAAQYFVTAFFFFFCSNRSIFSIHV